MDSVLERPRIGIGVIVRKDARVLVGKRIGKHGPGTWGFPGGHLEMFEEVFACAQRETWEEVGIRLCNMRIGPYTNDPMPEVGKHYVTLFVVADYAGGEVRVCEPDKCERWEWHAWNTLPAPIFLPIQHLHRSGFDPWAP